MMFVCDCSEQTAAMVAASGSLLSLALVFFFIPHIPKKKPSEDPSHSVIDLRSMLQLICLPGVGIIMAIKLVCGIPIGILQSMFSGRSSINSALPPKT